MGHLRIRVELHNLADERLSNVDFNRDKSILRSYFDPGSLLVITITIALFLAALVFKGFSHDLLLEAGILLVSVKLIVMSYKLSVGTDKLSKQIVDVHSALNRLETSIMLDHSTQSIRLPDDGSGKGTPIWHLAHHTIHQRHKHVRMYDREEEDQ